MKLSDRLFAGGRLRAGHRVSDRRPRQGARADDRHGHAHARRTAVRARHVREGRPGTGADLKPKSEGRSLRYLIRTLSYDVCRPGRAGRFFDAIHARPDAGRISSGCSRATRRRPTGTSRADIDRATLDALPWYRRWPIHARLLFIAFTMRLSPARRVLYAVAVIAALLGLAQLFRGFGPVPVLLFPFTITLPLPQWVDGAMLAGRSASSRSTC